MNQREIKFRAWRIKEKKMYEVGAINFKKNKIFCLLDNAVNYDGIYGLEVDKEIILMQFTGLKDRKGVEIYEGDIVVFYNPIIGEEYKDRFKHKTIVDMFNMKIIGEENQVRLEVIGNIYENKELLK